MRPSVALNKKHTSTNPIFPFRKTVFFHIVLLFFLPQKNRAEGSKELSSNGGARAYLFSSLVGNTSFPFPTLGTMKVYVKAGETLYVGSSAQGINSGTINLRAPDGNVYTSGTSTTVGLIANRSQEVAGPSPNPGGYTPYTLTATSAQEGVWEVDFIPPTANSNEQPTPTPQVANGIWAQPTGPYIAAFDISVRNVANTAFLTGRVFTNIFSGIISTFSSGFNGIMHILTKDGYQYVLDNNGQAGNGFSFFANNKGLRDGSGAASYKSVNTTSGPDVQDPRSPDTQTDITHKIFFNTPATDLPATAKTPGGGTTWLINPPFVPSIGDVGFIGKEGTIGKSGTSPLGGFITFTSTNNGTYSIIIDVDKNGLFTDAIDRKLNGTVSTGNNTILWDGLDGLGNKIPAQTVSYTANMTLSIFSAEVHFPFFDVERNVNGILLTRTTGPASPDNTVYWDDSQISLVGTPSSPIKNLTGINSLVNGHKWGSATLDPTSENEFGNNRSIDTWAYVSSVPITKTINFIIQEADLEVVSLTPDITAGCVGQTVNYTVVVRNNGPSDAIGSTFQFNFPKELTGISVTSAATTGTSAVTLDSTKTNLYKAFLNLPNGSVRTFTISGKVTGTPLTTLDVSASILRPTDLTDPDATNPDAAVPTDASAECDAQPSGTGCNNIKINSTAFLPQPNAGSDQFVDKNTIVTLTANIAGTWAQVGITPAIAKINAPASAKTTISGLTDIGPYSFTFTNTNGCADTVVVHVSSEGSDTPNIITPNGDGKNDVLVIKGIDLYPGSKLAIYNRWGNEVYHSDNYANNWGGEGLADGTYYYLLNRKEANGVIKVFKGWIYIKH